MSCVLGIENSTSMESPLVARVWKMTHKRRILVLWDFEATVAEKWST